ncbi:hypothetical protein NQ317_018629 [Molorchus minor]|uniref:B box-type domain-containing protein n=1 Tax=Molorchus minor TaxID=1323400 RepID=A0ABQ9J4F2_9CUCU|nr:hypothetical protein NQ317_018629 [Molorchus minor]
MILNHSDVQCVNRKSYWKKAWILLDSLPRNLYIDSLLKLISDKHSPIAAKPKDYRCVKCETVSQEQEHVCQHCMQIFCEVCWSSHISELNSNLSLLVNQIKESENRLKHKADNFINRCDKLNVTIKETVQQKIENIHKMENLPLTNEGRNSNKITTYMNLHRETANLLNEIYHYGEARIIFDPESFHLDQDTEGIYNEIEENVSSKLPVEENPFENVSSMIRHYKSHSFIPKLLWTKCPRPGE